MADVFISYAKPDRPLALKLAAMLEAEGWTTWWDTSLTIGDDFRNEIMTELGRARAVIVIWTDTSIKSDWVRSEAGRAQADRKLIPVKLAHLTYKDLPPPFDVLHTEDIGQEDKIRAAVVAQLAKPAVEPTPWASLTKGFKYEVLTWVGIVGGALTLFTAIAFTLVLAPWAQKLVENWTRWTHAFWVWAFGWLGIHLPPEWTPLLSFLLFWLLLTMGQVIKFRGTMKNQTITDKYQGMSFRIMSWEMTLCVCVIIIALIFGLRQSLQLYDWVRLLLNYSVVAAAILLAFAPAIVIVSFARYKLHAAVSVILIITFFTIITVSKFKFDYDINNGTAVLLQLVLIVITWISPLILLSVAPAKAVSRRLIFLAIGLLLLIALNELSKLGFDISVLKPPS
jgi:TIR domain